MIVNNKGTIEVYREETLLGTIDKSHDWFFLPVGLPLCQAELEEISYFLSIGEHGYLYNELAGVVETAGWWNRANESFGGKTPQEQLKADSTVIWNMLFRLQTGMPS